MFIIHYVSRVTCHVSRVMCHVSCVTCYMLHVLSWKKLDKVVELVGGGSVINGLPRLVLEYTSIEICKVTIKRSTQINTDQPGSSNINQNKPRSTKIYLRGSPLEVLGYNHNPRRLKISSFYLLFASLLFADTSRSVLSTALEPSMPSRGEDIFRFLNQIFLSILA